MTDERVEQILRQTLAPDIPDENLNRNLKKQMEETKMKKRFITVKKAAILAAVCCLLVGAVGVASSGKIAMLVSGFYHKEFDSLVQLSAAEESAGFHIKAMESFQNGYAFSDMCVNDTKALDESGNTVETYKQINISYAKAGETNLYFYAMEAFHAHEENKRPADRTMGINGVEVRYYVDTYKNVPAGYELTPEDEENLKRSDYYISEGADEISVNQHSYVIWYQDGVKYSIMNIYEAAPAEELFGMAKELIEQ